MRKTVVPEWRKSIEAAVGVILVLAAMVFVLLINVVWLALELWGNYENQNQFPIGNPTRLGCRGSQ